MAASSAHGRWRKSSRCQTSECAEIGAWRKSSHSDDTECAEVGQDGTVVAMRDSKDPDGPRMMFTPAAWGAFLAMVRST